MANPYRLEAPTYRTGRYHSNSAVHRRTERVPSAEDSGVRTNTRGEGLILVQDFVTRSTHQPSSNMTIETQASFLPFASSPSPSPAPRQQPPVKLPPRFDDRSFMQWLGEPQQDDAEMIDELFPARPLWDSEITLDAAPPVYDGVRPPEYEPKMEDYCFWNQSPICRLLRFLAWTTVSLLLLGQTERAGQFWRYLSVTNKPVEPRVTGQAE